MEFSKDKTRSLVRTALIFISLFVVTWVFYVFYKSPLTQGHDKPIIIVLDKSATAAQFARILKENNIIHSTKFFLSIVRLQGLSQQLKAGVYELKPGETAYQLLHKVVAGDVLVQNFTIIAGRTQSKIADDLSHASYLQYNPADWDKIKENHPNAEGLVLADTYQYRGGSDAKSLLQQANQNLIAYLNKNWSTKDSNVPYKNPYEMLIAASIIEKESAKPEERKLISGVMVNRLKKGMPLQMDPTVIYGLGALYNGKLTHNDMLVDSPYNTYRYRGLPPTPIATVGKESIDAAAHPTLSSYLYFVAKGDGSHQFSETYEQQRKAIDHYLHKDS